MRISEILREEVTKLTGVSCNDVSNFLKIKCPIAYNSPFKIYRGINVGGGLLYGDSSKHIRKSANTKNYYTLLFDHILPEWKSFPKRSRSFICSNDFDSHGHSYNYTVYPTDDPLIGICPKGDMWVSFKNIELNNVRWWFEEIARLYVISVNDNISSIRNFINEVDNKWVDINNSKEFKNTFIGHISGIMDIDLRQFNTFTEFLRWLFDPVRNRFEVKRLSEITKLNGEHEIWFSGPAYFRMGQK